MTNVPNSVLFIPIQDHTWDYNTLCLYGLCSCMFRSRYVYQYIKMWYKFSFLRLLFLHLDEEINTGG